jgi:hypothetical protein
MPLNINEASLDQVKPEFHQLYVKKDGKYWLDLTDLQSLVDAQLKPLRSELEVTQASERHAAVEERLGAALKRARVAEDGVELLVQRLGKRVTIETVEGARVVQVLQADGETPMAGSDSSGRATIDDLVNEAVSKFPSMFVPSAPGKDVLSSSEAVRTKADFRSEKERAEFVNKHGMAAYNRLGNRASGIIAKKSDFTSEKERAQWVGERGLTAYRSLPD